jgi:hypothetical protein
MCSRPDVLLESFARAGRDPVDCARGVGPRVAQLLWQIKALGRKVGLAINPPTAMAHLEPYLPHRSAADHDGQPGLWRSIVHHRDVAKNPAGAGLAGASPALLSHFRGRWHHARRPRRIAPRRAPTRLSAAPPCSEKRRKSSTPPSGLCSGQSRGSPSFPPTLPETDDAPPPSPNLLHLHVDSRHRKESILEPLPRPQSSPRQKGFTSKNTET